jgi:hypothetical protein
MQPTFWASHPPSPKHAALQCHPEGNAAAQTQANCTSANYSRSPGYLPQGTQPSFRPKQAEHFPLTFASCERVGLRSENLCPIARILRDEISVPNFLLCALRVLCAKKNIPLQPRPTSSPPPFFFTDHGTRATGHVPSPKLFSLNHL